MDQNPLNLYVKCSRLVFNVEPSEVWEDFQEFEGSLRKLYESVLCKACELILCDPVQPKKHHFSCQHRVCLDCIGKKRSTPTNCKMCCDYTLFEKSHQTKLLIFSFQDLCELVHSSWIYDYIQRRSNHDTGQSKRPNLIEIIDAGMNYGQVSIVIDETSSDENSSSSESSKEPLFPVPYSSPIFPNISPLSPVKPSTDLGQSSPEQFTIISDPVIPLTTPIAALPIVSSPSLTPVPHIVQYQPQIVQPQIPSTSKLTPNHQPTASFIKYPSPMRVTSIASSSPLGSKPIMTPMKIQTTFPSTTPTIYSVYTGSGNKITLKRRPPDEVNSPVSSNNNMTIIKTENVMSSSFKKPPMQISTTQQAQNQPPTSNSTTNVIASQSASNMSSNLNDLQKRRGCRCGNATAAPGKLTCCGQRCPCYVDSKACIDCKCKGCRNPHYVDGHKKMRHQVPDAKTQQQQQQNFLASIQQQATVVKDIHKSGIPSTSLITQEDFSVIEQSTIISKGQSAISNCIISMNSSGQYQIKQSHPRILVKDPIKTMSPLIFPTTTSIHQPVTTTIGNSNIQILGLYSQVPMINGEKKIIIKNEPTTVVTFSETKQLLETTTAFAGNNLNTNLL